MNEVIFFTSDNKLYAICDHLKRTLGEIIRDKNYIVYDFLEGKMVRLHEILTPIEYVEVSINLNNTDPTRLCDLPVGAIGKQGSNFVIKTPSGDFIIEKDNRDNINFNSWFEYGDTHIQITGNMPYGVLCLNREKDIGYKNNGIFQYATSYAKEFYSQPL